METLKTAARNGLVVEDEGDFLDFTLEDDDEEEQPNPKAAKTAASDRALARNNSLPDCVEEELEWLSNKEAFPSVESCFGILSDNPELVLNHQSPVSVLENSSSSSNNSNTNSNGSTVASCCESLKVPTNYPVRARSQRRRRKRRATGFAELPRQQCLWMNQVGINMKQESSFSFPRVLAAAAANGAGMGRRCLHCQADKTPQWRAGPMGPKTLCNACGVRYKSGRLLPEYRPANSPTFSSTLHSNSHRKVVEMRRQKQVETGGGVMANKGCGYSVGE